MGIRNVRENPPSLFLQGESLGMGREVDRTELLAVRGVDDGDAAVAEPHIDSALVGSNIVRIVTKAQLPDRLEGFCVVDFANPVLVIRDEKTIELGDVTDSLRRAQAGNGTNALAFSQIDYLDTVVAERTDEQTFARRVESEVIDPSFDTRERNCLADLE
jgi:hypothetical protein